MANPNEASFSLQPVVEGDIPELTALSGLTFDADRHTQLKSAHPTKPYDHAAGTPDAIRHWLSLPQTVEITKAVDNVTGQIVGCVGWVCRGFDRNPSGAGAAAENVPEPTKGPADSVSSEYTKTGSADLDPLGQLRELTDDHFARFMGKIMPLGTRCMFIAGI